MIIIREYQRFTDILLFIMGIGFEHTVWKLVSEFSSLSLGRPDQETRGFGGAPKSWESLICIKWVPTPLVSDNGAGVLSTILVTVQLHDVKRCWA